MNWDHGLSEEQKKVTKHIGSHARLLAGPGTGKTRVMTSRAAYLIDIEKVPANEVLALTFTRVAASELKSRVTLLLEGKMIPRVSTLHSFALHLILQLGAGDRLPSPIRIADNYEERWIIEEDIKQFLNLERVDDARDLIDLLSADWERLQAEENGWEERFPNPEFYGVWKEHRTIYGYTLKSELVYQLKKALEEGDVELTNSPKHILIDEYQDLNSCDLSIVKSLAKSGAELYVAGDDDQSIYGFRYADPGGIRKFTSEYKGSADLSLNECHRCGKSILTLARYVAEQDKRRIDKPLKPSISCSAGEVHLLRFADYTDEALGIAAIANWLVNIKNIQPDRILVLLRSDRYQKFSDPIRVAFESMGLPATTAEDPFIVLENANGRIFLSLLRLMANFRDSLAWRDILKQRNNNLGQHAVSSLYEVARTRGRTFYEALSMVSADPTIISKQGWQIKNEFESVSTEIKKLMEKLKKIEEPLDFISWMLNDYLKIEEAEDILKIINENIHRNAVQSINDLLNELATPIRNAEQIRAIEKINIMTMHQAKGLDAEVVFIAAAEDEYIPGRAEGISIDDERRLLYVSITRARSFLYITHCQRRTGGQRHTGRTSGLPKRTLTQFLSGGTLKSSPGEEFLKQLKNHDNQS